ncbi:5-methylcytosine-specific restriction endonuclease McrA [Planctomicrobium piriforme]|uniref:5-methylcytosine-specific restriction endonuclease McrA n=2 Tax=Planctomicrobium piriforme TaxID=1576369 RepID=A0A1I3G0R5_9PLAN|nr:HNH endonuclease [Planctomicrobium piriforme]SFI16751.1 5-methylcytosine-specific restriction endonuclease McrA [Planctomicrobium piriforme]
MVSLAQPTAPELLAVDNDRPLMRKPVSTSAALQANILALNRNFLAVQVISAKRAFCLLCKGLAEVIHVEGGAYCAYDFDAWRELCDLKVAVGEQRDYEDWIRAVNFEIQVPRVVRLLTYDRVPRNTVKFNRRNIFLRDGHRCQYCGKRYSTPRLSLDHVMPKSRGGADTWENIVCACLKCNVDKGGRTPSEAGMKLLQKPIKPKRSPLLSRQLSLSKYESWRNFIPHSTE